MNCSSPPEPGAVRRLCKSLWPSSTWPRPQNKRNGFAPTRRGTCSDARWPGPGSSRQGHAVSAAALAVAVRGAEAASRCCFRLACVPGTWGTRGRQRPLHRPGAPCQNATWPVAFTGTAVSARCRRHARIGGACSRTPAVSRWRRALGNQAAT